MADKSIKQPENVPGKWYVDTTCVPCGVCVDEAPTLLKYNADQTYVYFQRQPATPAEVSTLIVGCHVPGHYAKGMHVSVRIATQGGRGIHDPAAG